MTTRIQLSFNLDFRPAYGREDFFVGVSNEEAIKTIELWPNWGKSPFLIVYGDEGSGKKHIASVWQSKSDAIVLDVKKFSDLELSDLFASTPNVILHQLHLILGEPELEEKLFHIYNHYIGLTDKRHLLITSRSAPSELDISLPDLKSRIFASRQVRIKYPDDVLLMQVLGKQLNDKGFQPTEELLQYAIKLMERSWAMPKRLTEVLNKMSLEEQKGLTKKMIRGAILKIEQSGEQQEPSTQLAVSELRHF